MKHVYKMATLVVGLLCAVYLNSCSGSDRSQASSVRAQTAQNYADVLVSRVVDGDTIQLESRERVRLIGIDTPELHESAKLDRDSQRSGQSKSAIQAMGQRAYQFTKDLIEGKRVRLEFDVEPRDKYDRILAYVYLPDGTFVNAEIVKGGYASLLTIPPNLRYTDMLLQLYQDARKNKRGLWAE